MTGKRLIQVRWEVFNKDDRDNPEYRVPLVAKEINMNQCFDLFAATPPLEAKKFIFSLAMTKTAESGKPYMLQFIDMKRAFFTPRLCVMSPLVYLIRIKRRACAAS